MGPFMELVGVTRKSWSQVERDRQVLNCSGNDGGGVTRKLLRITTGRWQAALDWWQTIPSFHKYFFMYN